MIQLLDHFIIALPKVFDEGSDPGGLKRINTAYFIEKERDRYTRKVMKGTIYSVPVVYRELNHMPIDPGLPNHKLFIGHDAIQKKVNEGYGWTNHQYHPGAREGFDYITVADYGRMITAKKGDEIYFHPSVTESENELGEADGLLLYRAMVTELIAVGTVPQGGHVLVEPLAKANYSGEIVLSVDGEDKLLEGIVKFSRDGSGVSPGDHVCFQEDSNWDFFIGGVRYFAMLEENLLMITRN